MTACSFRARLGSGDDATENSDRGLGKRELSGRCGNSGGLQRRPIWVGGPAVQIWMPDILGFAESCYRNGASKSSDGFFFCVIERNAHGVRVFLVLVDDEQRPLAIGPQRRVHGDENMACSITNVTGGGENLVRGVTGLDPLQIKQLADEVLGERLFDLEIAVSGEKVERSGRAVVSTADRFRHVMEIIDSATAAAQERTNVVGKPQSAPDIHVSFRRSRRKI